MDKMFAFLFVLFICTKYSSGLCQNKLSDEYCALLMESLPCEDPFLKENCCSSCAKDEFPKHVCEVFATKNRCNDSLIKEKCRQTCNNYCGAVPLNEHCAANQTHGFYNDFVKYECDNGFHLVGEPYNSCIKDSLKIHWQFEAPTCALDPKCTKLTEDDVPANGGAACISTTKGMYCDRHCNPGYDFPDRINNYEVCNDKTQYIWNFRKNNVSDKLTSCIVEYFPGIRLENDQQYFSENCNDMKMEEIVQVKKNFLDKMSNSLSHDEKVLEEFIVCGLII